MPFCPQCGRHVQQGDAACASCGEALPAEISGGGNAPAAAGESLAAKIPDDWVSFRCWDGSFSLMRPADWRDLDPPASEGASLSCAGPDRFTLLEAFAFKWEGPTTAGDPDDLAKVIGDGIVETAGKEEGHSDGRLLSRRNMPLKNAETCERVVISYTDRGLETTTDYCIVGSGHEAVQLAIKVLSPKYEAILPVFEQIISTLETPWLGGDSDAQAGRRAENAPHSNDRAPATVAAQPRHHVDATAEPATIDDFYWFCGLTFGDTYDDAARLFGPPESVNPTDSGDKFYYYFDENLDIAADRDSDEIWSISVRRELDDEDDDRSAEPPVVAALRRRGVSDDKFRFLGQHRDSILAVFGEPESVSHDHYEYKLSLADGRDMTVSFICYDFNGHLCSEISVSWYDFRNSYDDDYGYEDDDYDDYHEPYRASKTDDEPGPIAISLGCLVFLALILAAGYGAWRFFFG